MAILFALFLSMFALDVFGEGYSFWETILALFMHLIPVYILVIALALAWRWEWVGALIFLGFSVLYLITAGGQHWSAYLVVAGPPLLIGLLFLFNWFYKPKLQVST
jgi:hypothetical protein